MRVKGLERKLAKHPLLGFCSSIFSCKSCVHLRCRVIYYRFFLHPLSTCTSLTQWQKIILVFHEGKRRFSFFLFCFQFVFAVYSSSIDRSSVFQARKFCRKQPRIVRRMTKAIVRKAWQWGRTQSRVIIEQEVAVNLSTVTDIKEKFLLKLASPRYRWTNLIVRILTLTSHPWFNVTQIIS